jgi:hypothetical protein
MPRVRTDALDGAADGAADGAPIVAVLSRTTRVTRATRCANRGDFE